VDKRVATALMMAALKPNADIVRVLAQRGAVRRCRLTVSKPVLKTLI